MGWIVTINIKQHLTGQEDPESVKAAANAIAADLEHKAKEPGDIVAYMACMGLPRLAKKLRRAGATGKAAAVNGILSELYDYADYNRIWLGL